MKMEAWESVIETRLGGLWKCGRVGKKGEFMYYW
jgi:hypothetical protein